MFEIVWVIVLFSCGLFGKVFDFVYIEKMLKVLLLWDKCDNKLMMLLGGMKCCVMIVKVLLYELCILFFDEFMVGVDVELCCDMWKFVDLLCESGVMILLIMYYIEEVEEMVDWIGIIFGGEFVFVEEKCELMCKFGKK